MVLAKPRIPSYGTHPSFDRWEGDGGGYIKGWGEISRQYDEVPPASGGGSARNSADMSEHRLDLFPGASCNLGLESPNCLLVPLTRSTSCHKKGLVGHDEEALKLAVQLQHRARGEVTDGQCEIQAARSPRARGIGAFA